MTDSNANEGRKVGHSALRWNKETQAMEMFDPRPVPASASHGDAPGFDEATESRWQKAIYEQCKRILPNVDGSGCESGDALDVTISEITQCFAHLQNERDSLRSERGGWISVKDRLPKLSELPCLYIDNCGKHQLGRPIQYDLWWMPLPSPPAFGSGRGGQFCLDQSANGLLKRIEDYRAGYSCGYADGKRGTRMRDKDAACLFFGIEGVPDISVPAPPASGKEGE